jgi:hypothetical protein
MSSNGSVQEVAVYSSGSAVLRRAEPAPQNISGVPSSSMSFRHSLFVHW